ncbi:hypothetical protein RF11_10201 [Thelohanellus kitauei]|uniref:Doublecortin domain-containing protein n=1 Tax=Thelohanellus kitauei TaxID=669202 RepID=A0A0C2IWA6_THEKT|nr:hypothetical protein RF11_10201 [Thelohanellus kitauei]
MHFKQIKAEIIPDTKKDQPITVYFTNKSPLSGDSTTITKSGVNHVSLKDLMEELSENLKLETGKVNFIYNEKNELVKNLDDLENHHRYTCTTDPKPDPNIPKSQKTQKPKHNFLRKHSGHCSMSAKKPSESQTTRKKTAALKPNLKPKIIEIVGDDTTHYKKLKYLVDVKYTPDMKKLLNHISKKNVLGQIDCLYTQLGAEVIFSYNQVKEIDELYSYDGVFFAGVQYQKFLKNNTGACLQVPNNWKIVSGRNQNS